MNSKRKWILVATILVFTCASFVGYLVMSMNKVQLNVRKMRVLVEAKKFRDALITYSNVFGNIPTQEVPAIIATLTGQNPSNIVFIDLDPGHFDGFGRYTDYWRTPYRIELTDKNFLIFCSAGRNRTFGDGDDIIVEQPLISAAP